MKQFETNSSESCIEHAMLLIKNYELQIIKDGYEWNYNTNSCRWTIEQAILNRQSGVSMLDAALEVVESIKAEVDAFNGINKAKGES